MRLVTKASADRYPEIGRALVEAAETMDRHRAAKRVRSGLALIAAGDAVRGA